MELYLEKESNKPLKKCKKCGSIHVTDFECESCGIRLQVDMLGIPFGNRSFYSLKNDYWSSMNWMIANFPFLERKKNAKGSKYKRALLNRYNVLIDYFFFDVYPSREGEKKVFMVELEFLVNELLDYNVSRSLFFLKLDDHDESKKICASPVYQKIAKLVFSEKSRLLRLLEM